MVGKVLGTHPVLTPVSLVSSDHHMAAEEDRSSRTEGDLERPRCVPCNDDDSLLLLLTEVEVVE